MADWSELPIELVELIANGLDEPEDFLSLSAVCHSWRLVYLSKRWTPAHQAPWLMLNEKQENGVLLRRFFSLSKSKVYKLPLPEAHGCRCWGSSHGWIVTIDRGYKIFLLNPITRVWISLPPCRTLGKQIISTNDWFGIINKASVFKIRGELVACAIYGKCCELAFARPGDMAWSTLQLHVPVYFCSIACFKDQIFALSMVGVLYFLQTDSRHPPGLKLIAAPPKGEKGWQQTYLVESSGHLLMVIGYKDSNWMKKMKFKVYRFDFNAETWSAVEDLAGSVLFIDDNLCSSVSTSLCHKRNSVYFMADNLDYMLTTDTRFMGQYMNVYDLKDKSCEVYCIGHHDRFSYTCPSWVFTTLW
ncbi:hypothetical protein ACH5RR_003117 [Cinchona calisaya]|uniref:KIB1-4 beta-propeller domain-containing protein n=1 Tax=Cinchona calisaya TaxID=153742 RepID=A0ABD3ATY6_9GENT